MFFLHSKPYGFTNSISHSRRYGSTDTRTHGYTDRHTNAQPNHINNNDGHNHNTAQRLQRGA